MYINENKKYIEIKAYSKTIVLIKLVQWLFEAKYHFFENTDKLFFNALFFKKIVPNSFSLHTNKSGFRIYEPNSVTTGKNFDILIYFSFNLYKSK